MKQVFAKKFQKKREISIVLILALILGIFSSNIMGRTEVKAAESDYGISNPRTDGHGATTWDCVYFGNYWQNDTNGDGEANREDEKEPIKWRVLSVDGKDAFLMSDQNLENQQYNDMARHTTWETSLMRSWLNSEFFENAFSETEQNAVMTTLVVDTGNPTFGVEGGNDTEDKVYVLSMEETMNPLYGFASHNDRTKTRESTNTQYVADGGQFLLPDFDRKRGAGETDDWCVRSPGEKASLITLVSLIGFVNRSEVYVSTVIPVRPVLHLDLESSDWSSAGMVSSEGGIVEEESPTALPSSTPTPTPKPTAKPTQTPNVATKPTETPAAAKAPSAVQKVTVKNKKKQSVALSWKKVSGAKGYQFQYALNKKFTKKKKSKLITKNKNRITIKKLKQKKTYYFRVRAYKLNGKKKVYGEWSKVKKIKIKK